MSAFVPFAPVAPLVELRIDPADGVAYDYNSFVMQYGFIDGLHRWMTALPPPPPAPPAPPPPPVSLVAHAGLLDAITKGATKIVQERAAEKLAMKVKIEAEVKKLDKDIEVAESQLAMSEEKGVILNDVTAVVEKEKFDINEYLTNQEEKQDALKALLQDPRKVGRQTRKRARDEEKQPVDTGGAAETGSGMWQLCIKIAGIFMPPKKK
jgi:hypothetical protein